MLYSRAILLTMLLALAGAGSGVNAAPAHVCRDLVPRGADGQEAQIQSSAPESSSKSTALGADSQEARIKSSPPQNPIKAEAYYGRDFRRCGDILGHFCPGPSVDEVIMVYFSCRTDIFREGEFTFIKQLVDEVKCNPCRRRPEGCDDRDATKVLEAYYRSFKAGDLKEYFEKKRTRNMSTINPGRLIEGEDLTVFKSLDNSRLKNGRDSVTLREYEIRSHTDACSSSTSFHMHVFGYPVNIGLAISYSTQCSTLPSIDFTMLYTRTILPSMFLALAGAGVIAAPAHVCRELVPRAAGGQEAQSQSPAPVSSRKPTALNQCHQPEYLQRSEHRCEGIQKSEFGQIVKHIISKVEENPCGRSGGSENSDFTKYLEEYYNMFKSGCLKDLMDERMVRLYSSDSQSPPTEPNGSIATESTTERGSTEGILTRVTTEDLPVFKSLDSLRLKKGDSFKLSVGWETLGRLVVEIACSPCLCQAVSDSLRRIVTDNTDAPTY
ncbi:hypothetical protein EV360DRAFT_74828 [Lentinula raphanica]|nr:hypothetical protein EV360DRAFT_74828 [Lentinula raphanica]